MTIAGIISKKGCFAMALPVITLPLGALGTNCYIISYKGQIYVIDPAAEADTILLELEKLHCEKPVILLTHAHFDHIGALPELAKRFGQLQIFLSAGDRELYKSPLNAYPPFCPPIKNLPETSAESSNLDCEILPTPGHTRGGVCFYFPELKTLFSGDTLFAGSVGRTDLGDGDMKQLLNSVRTKLWSLPDDTAVYPGHGGSTTIGREKRTNPFFL